MDGSGDIDIKRRLKKAVSVTEKLQRKLVFEIETNKELARRNEALKAELSLSHEKCQHLEDLLRDLDQKISAMRDYVDELADSYLQKQLLVLTDATCSGLTGGSRMSASIDRPLSSRSKGKTPRDRAPSLYISTSLSGTSLIRKSLDEVPNLSSDPQQTALFDSPSLPNDSDAISPTKSVSADLEVQNIDVSATQSFHLFEHFIVVGATPSIAADVGLRLKQMDESNLSSRFMKTIGGFLSSSSSQKQLASAATSKLPPNQGISTSSQVENVNHETEMQTAPVTEDNPTSLADVSQRFSSLPSISSAISSTASSMSPSKFMLPMFSSSEKRRSSKSFDNDDHSLHDETLATTIPFVQDNALSEEKIPKQDVSIVSSLSSPRTASAFANIMPRSLFTRSSSLSSTTSSTTVDESLSSPSSHHVANLPDDLNHSRANLSDDSFAHPLNGPAQAINDKSLPNDEHRAAEFSVNANGNVTTDASILFRYPPAVEPPPPEIVDFCLPVGGKLRRISHKNDDTTVQEILYGSGQSKRSGRCFIFTLDDKSSSDDYINEELGAVGGRLYGVCVIHSRLLEVSVPTKENTSTVVDFESTVCLAFLTRFPMFTFFFQVIFDIITTDRLLRMEEISNKESLSDMGSQLQQESPFAADKRVYHYIPQDLLNQVLETLSQVKPPRFGEIVCFQASSGILPINILRSLSSSDSSEYSHNTSNWALPTFLSCFSPKLIIWIISLILCEAKIIVIGSEPGLVSSTVFGLLALIRPLEWVAPLIPMLPLKHIDFVESPVPIIAGLMLDSTKSLDEAVKILDRCNDQEYHNMTIVIDVNKKDICLSSGHLSELSSCVLPGAPALADKLENIMGKSSNRSNFNEVKTAKDRISSLGQDSSFRHIVYSPSQTQIEDAENVRLTLNSHISALVAMAKEFSNKTSGPAKSPNDLASSASTKSSLTPIKQASDASSPTLYFFTSDDEEDDEDEADISGDTVEIIENRKNANLLLLRQFYSRDGIRNPDKDSLTPSAKDASKTKLTDQFLSSIRSGPTLATASIGNSSKAMSDMLTSFIGSSKETTNHPIGNTNTAQPLTDNYVYTNASTISIGGSSIICLSKLEEFHGDNEKFFERFVATQMYCEYLNESMEELQPLKDITDRENRLSDETALESSPLVSTRNDEEFSPNTLKKEDSFRRQSLSPAKISMLKSRAGNVGVDVVIKQTEDDAN